MKYYLLLFPVVFSGYIFAQDAASLIEKGKLLEQKQKETEAFEKYKEAARLDPTNIAAFVKLSDLSTTIGARQTTPEAQAPFFIQAKYGKIFPVPAVTPGMCIVC